MKEALWIIVAFALCVQPSVADGKHDARKVVKDTVEAVLAGLRVEGMSDESKRDRIMDIITPVFDFPLMAKLALGKLYWPKLDEAEKKEYTELFIAQLKNSYSAKIALFTDEKVEYEEPVQVKTKVHVGVTVISKDERNKMLYKLYQSKGNWRVYDVEIQGVSIISSYRSQYAQVLKTGSVADLLKKMKDKTRTDGDDGS